MKFSGGELRNSGDQECTIQAPASDIGFIDSTDVRCGTVLLAPPPPSADAYPCSETVASLGALTSLEALRTGYAMRALELLGLPALMQRSRGHADIVIGLLDGPVSPHPDLPGDRLRSLAGGLDAGCGPAPRSSACLHGLFVAGMLVGKRGSPAPAIDRKSVV